MNCSINLGDFAQRPNDKLKGLNWDAVSENPELEIWDPENYTNYHQRLHMTPGEIGLHSSLFVLLESNIFLLHQVGLRGSVIFFFFFLLKAATQKALLAQLNLLHRNSRHFPWKSCLLSKMFVLLLTLTASECKVNCCISSSLRCPLVAKTN